MIMSAFRYIVTLCIVLVFGCSFSHTQLVKNEGKELTEVLPAKNLVNNEEKISDITASIQEKDEKDLTDDDYEVYEDRYAEDMSGDRLQISRDDKGSDTPIIGNTEKDQNLLDTALDFCNTSQELWSEGNLEKALATLDQAYALVLEVDTDNNPELIQQKEDLRFMISKRILEIYASRYTAVNGNHDEIPLTMNEYVEKEIKIFQGRERKFFMESYKLSGKYIDKIKQDLKEAGLPEELAWLPLIESGFKVKALSRARALGLWQFISSTGYKFGLKRDTWVDERLDPEKSTAAAIAYLKELHQIFGDWTTVLAGYNCGEGTVLKKIRNQKINYLDNFWDLYEQLPRETARYVPRFLATLHILRNPEKYGFELEEIYDPLSYESVIIEKPVQLKTVANTLGISFKEITELNPELRLQVTPAAPYSLKVPSGMGTALLAKLEEIPKWAPPKNAYVIHRVKRGETLSLIAMRYRTSVRKIVMANYIRRKHFIRVGQKLKIPLRGSLSSRIYASKDKLLPDGKYRIKKGDSLWLIARKFNTNTKTLQRINSLKTTRLYVGQVLKITE